MTYNIFGCGGIKEEAHKQSIIEEFNKCDVIGIQEAMFFVDVFKNILKEGNESEIGTFYYHVGSITSDSSESTWDTTIDVRLFADWIPEVLQGKEFEEEKRCLDTINMFVGWEGRDKKNLIHRGNGRRIDLSLSLDEFKMVFKNQNDFISLREGYEDIELEEGGEQTNTLKHLKDNFKNPRIDDVVLSSNYMYVPMHTQGITQDQPILEFFGKYNLNCKLFTNPYSDCQSLRVPRTVDDVILLSKTPIKNTLVHQVDSKCYTKRMGLTATTCGDIRVGVYHGCGGKFDDPQYASVYSNRNVVPNVAGPILEMFSEVDVFLGDTNNDIMLMEKKTIDPAHPWYKYMKTLYGKGYMNKLYNHFQLLRDNPNLGFALPGENTTPFNNKPDWILWKKDKFREDSTKVVLSFIKDENEHYSPSDHKGVVTELNYI